jgi:sulfite exporter TauE/SafE
MSSALLAMLVLGLVSSVHCAGMCGGIVVAFSSTTPLLPKRELFTRQAAFNAGRLCTYAMLGAMAGTLGSLGAFAAEALSVQIALYVLANTTLVLVGIHLAGFGGPLAWLEALGASLWRRLQPLTSRLLPGGTLPRSYAAGLLWGTLPCGLVYGALAISVFAGGAAEGALGMLAFGAGTLPALMAAGLAAARFRSWLGRRPVRAAAGGLVLAFGAYGLANAGDIAQGIRTGILCF